MFPNRPLLFKEGTPFNCHNINKGVYVEICINPTCRYANTIMYVGSSGNLRRRMEQHINEVEKEQNRLVKTGSHTAVGVDGHFIGECHGFMRFLFLRKIGDDDKRLSKEIVFDPDDSKY